uniref:Wzy n=1 Tax=Proteus vulgaris TaxID=585 RepID=D9YZ49_PROVU|nr:Wzy [Proteus vulgaris]
MNIIRNSSSIFLGLLLFIYPIYSIFSAFGLILIFPFNFINISLATGVIFIFILSIIVGIYKFNIYNLISFSFFILLIVTIIINYNIYSKTEDERLINAIRYYLPFIIISLSCFIAGYINPFFFVRKWYAYFILLIITSLTFIVINYTSLQSLRLDFNKLVNSNYIGVYQLIGDSLSFCILLFIARKNIPLRYKYILFIISFIILFTFNSRASFFSFLFAITSIFIINKKNILRNIFLFLILLFSLYFIINGLYSTYYSKDIIELLKDYNHRMYDILTGNFLLDPSVQGRLSLLTHSLDVIVSNPLAGEFASQANINIDGFGIRWGAYTHNILVYWDQFGILPFLLLIFLLSHSFKDCLFIKKELNLNLIPLFLFVIVEQVFMRSFNYYLIFLYIGITQGIIDEYRYSHNNKKFI